MLEQIGSLIDLVIHFDTFLPLVIEKHGLFVYIFLFLIVFLETGVVIAPYLPGDSLLFLVGATSAHGDLNIFLSLALLILAAIAGDTLNYWIGRAFGTRYLSSGRAPFIKQYHIERTESFFETYGGKTIAIARFVPFVRTLAPFLAGAGRMDYARFLVFNVAGGAVWVLSFLLAGYFFGNLPIVSDHFNILALAIVGLSLAGAGSMLLGLKKI